MAVDTGYFTDYEPTTYDPGWTLTVIVVALNFLITTSLPVILWIYHQFWKKSPSVGLHDTIDESSDEFLDAHGATGALQKYPIAGNLNNPTTFPKPPGSVVSDGYSSIDDGSTISQQIARNILNVKKHKTKLNNPKTRDTKQDVATEADGAENGDDPSVVKSVMSRLDDDAVSAQDAVDADDGLLAPKEEHKSRFQQLLDIADWDSEMQQIWSLTIPYSIQGLFEGAFSTIDVALIGHFLGTTEANAYITVTILIEFTATFTYGFTEAIGTLCPQADGANNPVLMGRYLQLSMIFFLIGAIPGVVMWSFLTDEAVRWFGFDEQTAQMAQQYAFPYLAVTLIDGIDSNLLEFFNVTDHEKYCTVYYVVGHSASTLALLLMVLFGVKDLVLVGTAQAFVAFVLMTGNFTLGKYMGWMDECWEGFAKSLSLRDRRAVHTMMITAVPLGISWILTYGEWEVMTIFAGFMGPAEVAAWGLIGYIWSSFEYLTDGLSSAAEARVGFRVGAGRPQVAKFCAYKGVYLGVIVSIFATSILFILAPYLPGWITPDPTLQRMIFDLIPLIGFGQISMSVGSVFWSIIGAQGRMRLATTVEIVTSWFLAIPLAAILVFIFNFNLLGLTTALLVSYSIGGVATGFIIMTSDWEALTKKVVEYSGNEGVKYDSYDWSDLPPHIKKAAAVLGYNKKKWDTSGETETSDKAWAELTPNQKEAAKLIGYTKEKWDKDDDESSSSSSSDDEDGNTDDGVKIPVSRNLDDLSWDNLPPDAQKAAGVLGINKTMWDNDEEPESSDKYWKELTAAEQKAATVLGYDEEKWNAGSDSEGDDA